MDDPHCFTCPINSKEQQDAVIDAHRAATEANRMNSSPVNSGQVLTILHSIEDRLCAIEVVLTKQPLSDAVVKSLYNTDEVAVLPQQYGVKKAAPFTVRKACNDGRVPEGRSSLAGSTGSRFANSRRGLAT